MKKIFCLFITILLFACHPESNGGKPLSQKSRNYCKGPSGYYYSPGNHPIIFGYFPLEVDENSFEVLAEHYAKDKDQVFCWRYVIDADPATFKVFSDNFAKDDKHVFFRCGVVDNADARSFYLNETGVPLDKNHIFIYNPTIQNYVPSTMNLDRASIERLYPKENPSGGYSQWMFLKDKNGVYWGDEKLPVDVKSFHRRGFTWNGGECWGDNKSRYCEEVDPATDTMILKKK